MRIPHSLTFTAVETGYGNSSPTSARQLDADYCRAAFLLLGMAWGRNFGSAADYVRHHQKRIFIANACVVVGKRVCVWRGDVDLASTADQRGLISASRLLNRKLHVIRELSDEEIRRLPRGWLPENAVATAWRGRLESAGYFRQLYGSLEQIAERYCSSSHTKRCRHAPTANPTPL